MKDEFTIPPVYLPIGTSFEKLILPELAEWAQMLWGEERVRPRGPS